MNIRRLTAPDRDPPSLAQLDPSLVRPPKPPVKVAPVECHRFPFVAIPDANVLDGPDGSQRIRQFIKQLGRQHRIRVEWLPSVGVAINAASTKRKRSGQRRSAQQPTDCAVRIADVANRLQFDFPTIRGEL